MQEGESLAIRLFERARDHGTATALVYREDDQWIQVSWDGLARAVQGLALHLAGLGVRPGDRVLLFADNGPAWSVADLAVLALGAVSVPVYPTSAPSQVADIARRSGARFAICDPNRSELIGALDSVSSSVVTTGTATPAGWLGLGLPDPAPVNAAAGERLVRGARRIRGVDTAVIIYTSGATGEPKGVRLTHQNLIWTAESRLDAIPIGANDRTLCLLPLSHVASRMNCIVYPVTAGAQVWFGGGMAMATMVEDLAACRPTNLFAVPRVLERLLEALAQRAETLGNAAALRELGLDELRCVVSGGAPLALPVFDGLVRLGVEVCEIYGQTETCGIATVNRPGQVRRGTVGTPTKGVELRLADDSEVLVRGGMTCDGYEKDPARSEALYDADGWLRTGDLGTLEDNYLTIIGRKADMLITSGGKNVYPGPIERAIADHPYVAQAIVVGDGRPYLVALVEPAGDRPEATEAVCAHVENVNAHLSRSERVKRVAIVAPFPQEAFTPTFKVRRSELERRLSALLAALYARPRVEGVECVDAGDLHPGSAL
jgi:long-chain acyl-CoA synthetase